ncbi:HNH endonuclease signature motif containing protein [Rhodococcus sp. IEGM 1379]|nr:HNH endonuclease signature motif containing protein [Rhodococcus sp. IEGM 1379]MDI9917864.1 HNH endonuclease signature motif containing protein [Rhodococcus sp. IEGM 1379]
MCGQPGVQVDHIINVKAGGTDDMTNLQVLCARCHEIKTQREARVGRAKSSRHRPAERHPGLL